MSYLTDNIFVEFESSINWRSLCSLVNFIRGTFTHNVLGLCEETELEAEMFNLALNLYFFQVKGKLKSFI